MHKIAQAISFIWTTIKMFKEGEAQYLKVFRASFVSRFQEDTSVPPKSQKIVRASEQTIKFPPFKSAYT